MTARLTVGDVMTHNPQVVGHDAPLRQARGLMVEHEVHHLPVVKHGELVGVLSDRDLKRALDPQLGLPPEDELFVEDVCVFDAYTVPVTEPLEHVLRQMSARHIGSALVTDGPTLQGIFTASDACRLFADYLQSTARPAVAARP